MDFDLIRTLSPRLLFVIGNLDVGGAERHLVQVLPLLMERGFDVRVFTLTGKGKLAANIESKGIIVVQPILATSLRSFPAIFRKPLLSLVATCSYIWLLCYWRPKIIHFFLPAAYLFGGILSFLIGTRVLIMSRRSLNHYQLKRPMLARIERLLHGRMRAVLGNSSAVVEDLVNEGVDESRLGLIYNGVDLTSFNNLAPRGSVKKLLGLGDNTFLMVCVANLIPYKGHVDLIQALGSIKEGLPNDWAIAMVGRDTGIGQELRRLAEYQGVQKHIIWLGERSDSIEIISAADIGILCSHEEGFSNSVLEGMAANVAMIVTDVGGNREAVLDGECGLIAPPKSPESLGNAILLLAHNSELRQRMAVTASCRVKQEFTLDVCVRKYANLYKALLTDTCEDVQKAINKALV